jgi:hypothetical protein
VAQLTGAWRELLDLGRDLGIVPAAHTTRREQAAHAEQGGLTQATAIAVATDAAVFGPRDPDDAAVARVWALVEETRHGATADFARWRRAWVAVNPASLWASRAAWRAPAAGSIRRPPASRGLGAVMTRLRRPGAMAGGTHR